MTEQEDPRLIQKTALPGLLAHRTRHLEWLAARPDRFSQLMAVSIDTGQVGDRLVSQSTLTADEREEVKQLAPTAATQFADEQRTAVQRLRDLLSNVDPFEVLATITFTQTFITKGEYYEPTHQGSEVVVELIAGVLLTQKPGALERPSSATIQQLLDLAAETIELTHMVNMASRFVEDEAVRLGALATSQWLGIRGWSYEHHARDVTLAIYRPIDQWMLEDLGFTIDDFYLFVDSVQNLVEGAVNELGRRTGLRLAEAMRSDSPEDFMAALDDNQREMSDAMTVAIASVVKDSGLGEGRANHIVDFLGTEFGALPADAYTGPFDVSPLFSKPLVRRGPEFQAPVPGHLVREAHALFERPLLEKRKKFAKHRASVLDGIAMDLLVRELPGCVSVRNAYYVCDGERCETDGLILFENILLVVEGKAGALSVASRRGDIVRADKDLRKTMHDAWEQGARTKRYIETANPAVFTDERGNEIFSVDAREISRVILINPTLHSLGIYALQLPRLRALGLFDGPEVPWSVLVTDLRVICEMVETPAELLHYLEWRIPLPIGDTMMVLDELDLLGAWMFGTVGREHLDEHESLFFASSTTDFDAYYAGEQGRGPVREKPRRVLGDLVETRIRELAEARPRKWLEQSFALLDLPLVEAAMIDALIHRLDGHLPGDERWVATEVKKTTLVVLSEETTFASVALEVAAEVTKRDRLVIVNVGRRGSRITWSERRR